MVYLYQIYTKIVLYVGPVLICLGAACNLTAGYVVVKSKALWKNNISLYILVLAIVDTLVLSVDLGYQWFHIWNNKPKPLQDFHEIISTNLTVFESWILVSISIERLIAVYWPFQYKSWCTKRKALLGLTLVYFLALAVAIFISLYTVKSIRAEIIIFSTHFAFKCALPLVIMIITSTATVVEIVKTNKQRLHMNVQTMKAAHASVTMLVICITFVLLTGPEFVMHILCEYFFSVGNFATYYYFFDLYRYAYFLYYLNFVVKFFIYSMSNPVFCKEFKRILKCKK